ncbi:hypothetical protein TNCV_197541, partial [Trichonephila clavipes]
MGGRLNSTDLMCIVPQHAGVKNGRSLQGKLADGTVVEVEIGASFFTDPIADTSVCIARKVDKSILELG